MTTISILRMSPQALNIKWNDRKQIVLIYMRLQQLNVITLNYWGNRFELFTIYVCSSFAMSLLYKMKMFFLQELKFSHWGYEINEKQRNANPNEIIVGVVIWFLVFELMKIYSKSWELRKRGNGCF